MRPTTRHTIFALAIVLGWLGVMAISACFMEHAKSKAAVEQVEAAEQAETVETAAGDEWKERAVQRLYTCIEMGGCIADMYVGDGEDEESEESAP